VTPCSVSVTLSTRVFGGGGEYFQRLAGGADVRAGGHGVEGAVGDIVPVDLYVPRDAVSSENGALRVELGRRAAYEAWHRPLKRAPHGER